MLEKNIFMVPKLRKIFSSIGLIGLALLLFLGNSSCSGNNHPKAQPVDLAAYGDESADPACSYFYFMWGKSAEFEEKYNEAYEAYEKALVCDEQANYVRQRLAVLLMNMGKKEQAIIELEKMIEADPANLQNKLLLGNIYTSMERNKEAIKVYESVLETDPDEPHVLMLLGALYAREREYTQAQKILEHLVQVEEKSYTGYMYLAKLYRELHYYEKSMDAYEKALSLNWSGLLAYEAVDLYEYRQKFGKAINIYRRLLEEDEANTKIRGRLSRLYLQQGKVDEAVAELQELKNYTDDIAVVDLAIGRILLDAKRYKEAIALFEEMLTQDDNRDVARSMLALTYYESGNSSKAKEILEEVPSSSKDYENSMLMLVQILVDEDDKKRAMDLLRNAISSEETRRAPFYFMLAGLTREEDGPAAGKAVFEQAITYFPADHKVWFEYGLYLDRIGELDEALIKMEKVLELSPDEAYALNYIGYTWADKSINLDKALDYIKRAVALKPEDGFVRDSLGWVYYRMEKYDQAVTELSQAASMQPDDPTIHEHLGDALRKAGQLENAIDAYQKALLLYTDDAKKAHALAEIQALKKQLQIDK